MSQNSQVPKATSQKLQRPGSRQQERIERQRRRQRRRNLVNTLLTVIVLLVIVGVAYLVYQQRAANQSQSTSSSSTSVTSTSGTSTASTSSAPATPPPVSGKQVVTPDGLKYIDVKEGTGRAAKTGDSVAVQYTGWLESTKQKFDSSYDHGGQPYTFTLGQHHVIPGWDEGLVGMKVGGMRRLIIPPSLGYGSTDQGPIPANSTLIFDVTLTGIQ